MKELKLSAVLLMSSLLIACGGDSDDETSNDLPNENDDLGFFIDSPVSGISYQSSSYSGVTDELGRFQFEEGETIVFSLGDIQLPGVTAATAIHVSDLFEGGLAATSTVNLARLLLTIDSDGDEDNGIQISTDANDSSLTPETLDFSSDTFDTDVQSYLTALGEDTLVTAQEAQEHISETLAEVEGLNTGCGNECVPRAAFNEFVESFSPRYEEQEVALDTNFVVTLTESFELDMADTRIELHGVPTGTYENCRIDWPGFRCDDLGIESYDVADTINEYNASESVSGNTLTVNPGVNLKPNYTYVVHVFNDGLPNVGDDFKTWWRFNTVAE